MPVFIFLGRWAEPTLRIRKPMLYPLSYRGAMLEKQAAFLTNSTICDSLKHE
jgi:hypothetical protein